MKNWKIGARIIAGFAVVIAIAATLGIFAYSRTVNIDKSGFPLYDDYLPSVVALSRLQYNTSKQTDLLVKHIHSRSTQEMDAISAQIKAISADSEKSLQEYEATGTTSEEAALYEKIKTSRMAFLTTFGELEKLSLENTDASTAKAQALLDSRLRPEVAEYSGEVQTLINLEINGASKGMQFIRQAVSSAKFGIIIGLLLAICCAVVISLVIVRSITIPLAVAVKVLNEVGKYNLSVSLDVDSKDEIGQMARSLNSALGQLRNTLSAVTDSARSATSSSQELASSAESIASGSQEQAASLEETSASLEEITATVRQSADNAREANQLALSSRESAEKGQQVVAAAVTAMTEINAASAKIADIISTVEEIAFQTNLLAVNAAVEAARAGDEGRGFAVVATEVRSLAQRSAGAAKEIKGLIQDSLHKVQRGSDLVNRSGETLQGIMTAVKRVTDIVGEISAAANEQSTGIDQVNTAVTQIDQVTQANSAQTEELSATAQSLSRQSGRLLKLVGVFTLQTGKTGDDTVDSFGEPEVAAVPTKVAKRKVNSVKVGYKPQRGGLLGAAPAMMATAGGGSSDSFEEF